MKHSEHPFLLTKLNLTLEGRKKVDGWQLVYLLPDIEVSDLEKQMNNKLLIWWRLVLMSTQIIPFCYRISIVTFRRSKQVIRYLGSWSCYDKSLFPDWNDHWWYRRAQQNLWFRGGNGLYRRYVCRDCLVATEDADNPDIGCERRKVSNVKKFLNKFLDKNAYPDGKLPHLSIVSPNLMANTQQQTSGAVLYRIILLCLH